jgi:hypothetical protein
VLPAAGWKCTCLPISATIDSVHFGAAVFARIRLRDVHWVLKLETVAAAVSPSDKRVPHCNLAVRRRLRVSVLDQNGLSDLQICTDNCP